MVRQGDGAVEEGAEDEEDPSVTDIQHIAVKYSIIILHGYQLHIYKDYILAHQEEDSLFRGTKIKTTSNNGKVEENQFRVKPAKMRGGCQVN